ncbi:MAG TPA: hypothetical protein VGR16_02720 [Thermomicrobiales bacterium]|nr:hypothetical protein [Thermomicrobiales bacterium]
MDNADRQTLDALDAFLDHTFQGRPADSTAIDPGLAESARRFYLSDDAPAPDPMFLRQLREDLMINPIPAAYSGASRWQPPVALPPRVAISPTPILGRGPDPAAVRPRRWWLAIEAAAVAVLFVAIVAGYAALNGGSSNPADQPESRIAASTPESAPFGVGEGFSGGGAEVNLPNINNDSAEVRLRRVTFAPGAAWELPAETTWIASVEDGTLTFEWEAARPTEVRDGIISGDRPVTMRNEGTEGAVALLATVAPADQGAPPPTGVAAEELGGGEAHSLPDDPAFAMFGQIAFNKGQGGDVTDTGRDGLALIAVDSGSLRLRHLAGELDVFRGGTATGQPVLADREVTLTAGDAAVITGGAVLTVANAGDDRLRAVFFTIRADSPFPEPGAIVATPSAMASPIITEDGATPAGRADSAEPVDPAECDVEPRPVELTPLVTGTPEPREGEPGYTPEPVIEREEQLPQGQPADTRTIAAVQSLEREFAACYNAGDLPRVLALMTDEAARELLSDLLEGEPVTAESVTDLLATQAGPLPYEEWIALFPVRDVRVLPDGRVGAIVEWGSPGEPTVVQEANFHIYELVDFQGVGTRILLDEELGSFIPDCQRGDTPQSGQGC